MNYLQLFKYNQRLIIFGFLLNFFSSFGQTYVHAQFVPSFINDFQLTNTQFGLIYAVATLAGAFSLMYFGKFIDQIDLKNYVLIVTGVLIIACLVILSAQNFWFLGFGIFLNRLTGQGLLTHISLTSMARYFNKMRGKALSFAVLGHSGGQAVFPILMAFLVSWLGWREAIGIEIILILFILIPFIFYVFKKPIKIVEKIKEVKAEEDPKNETSEEISFEKSWKRREVFRDTRFFLFVFSAFSLHFLVTGFHFFQVDIALSKGWSANWIAVCFIAYAFARASSSIFTGILIDKFSGIKLTPFFLIPLMAGLITMIFFDHYLIAFPYLIGMAISTGMMASINSAVLAELYGVKTLGAIRGMYGTFVIASTSLAPFIMGYLIDSGFDFNFIMTIALISLGIASLLNVKLWKDSEKAITVP
ncbi:MAG: MFS transporter [Flammeovirgaceae bacterium]|nr:MFS transporter [Flammeovirgaceae bacterium]